MIRYMNLIIKAVFKTNEARMDVVQKKAFKNRVDSLKRENKKLSEKLAVLRKEKQLDQPASLLYLQDFTGHLIR